MEEGPCRIAITCPKRLPMDGEGVSWSRPVTVAMPMPWSLSPSPCRHGHVDHSGLATKSTTTIRTSAGPAPEAGTKSEAPGHCHGRHRVAGTETFSGTERHRDLSPQRHIAVAPLRRCAVAPLRHCAAQSAPQPQTVPSVPWLRCLPAVAAVGAVAPVGAVSSDPNHAFSLAPRSSSSSDRDPGKHQSR